MQTQAPNQTTSELLVHILDAVTDAIAVTDGEEHLLYWNRAMEELYGLSAQEVLGRSLGQCCPDLYRVLREPAVHQQLTENGRWTGEVVRTRPAGGEVYLQCSVGRLEEGDAYAGALLWMQRDITEQKRLELDLLRSHQLGAEIANLPGPESTAPPPKGDVVLWAEDDDNDAVLLSRAWRIARVQDQLIRVHDGLEVIRYLQGEGMYHDRQRYPIPALLLLDLRMPCKSGLETLRWIRPHPQFHDLPVVILTSFSGSGDVREAAELGVKGYLVKPVRIAEWVLKVQTLTSQCKV